MKKILTIDQQIALLESRGMIVVDKDKAKEILLDKGYYRLGFYAFPFEQTFPALEKRTHQYNKGTTFEGVVELYYFDYNLRRLLSDILNRIEVNLRTRITYLVSLNHPNDPHWFVNPQIVDNNFVRQFDANVYKTVKDNPPIQRHHQHHPKDKYAPAWKTLEFMTLGSICMLFNSLKDKEDKQLVANSYKCSNGVFANYLENIRRLRNKCAHGNCIYNITLPKGVKTQPANVPPATRQYVAGLISVATYFLKMISTDSQNKFEQRLNELLNKPRTPQTQQIILNCTKLTHLDFVHIK